MAAAAAIGERRPHLVDGEEGGLAAPVVLDGAVERVQPLVPLTHVPNQMSMINSVLWIRIRMVIDQT